MRRQRPSSNVNAEEAASQSWVVQLRIYHSPSLGRSTDLDPSVKKEHFFFFRKEKCAKHCRRSEKKKRKKIGFCMSNVANLDVLYIFFLLWFLAIITRGFKGFPIRFSCALNLNFMPQLYLCHMIQCFSSNLASVVTCLWFSVWLPQKCRFIPWERDINKASLFAVENKVWVKTVVDPERIISHIDDIVFWTLLAASRPDAWTTGAKGDWWTNWRLSCRTDAWKSQQTKLCFSSLYWHRIDTVIVITEPMQTPGNSSDQIDSCSFCTCHTKSPIGEAVRGCCHRRTSFPQAPQAWTSLRWRFWICNI